VIDLHGHDVAYRRAGAGQAIVLLHGIAGSNTTWDELLPVLARDHDVIAPDLPGHGESGSSAGDYSVGAMAATVRDLLLALGVERVTVVGHSLGGGVAMQFAYLFPDFTERLILISAGGLGRSVNPVLASAALPGAELVTAVLGQGTRLASKLYRSLPVVPQPGRVVEELERGLSALAVRETRAAFHATLRSVVGFDGQRVFAGDRLYLAAAMPTLIVWGERDRIIPAGHGHRAHAAMPGSELVVMPDVGHFPPMEAPEALGDAVSDFMARTEPAIADPERFRRLLRKGPA
jgi:pimeloyl-ACP methyl ester carboxylesterase